MTMRTACQRGLSVVLVLMTLLVWPSPAPAGNSTRYDVAYIWSRDINQVLDVQETVAKLLAIELDTQVRVVGRGKEYGVVRGIPSTRAQANRLADRQAPVLRKAGLKPAVVRSSEYHRLYHVRYTQGADPETLTNEAARIQSALGVKMGDALFIEKIAPHSYAIIQHRWASRSAALGLAKKQAALLKSKRIPATIIIATRRPIASGASLAKPHLAQETRIPADSSPRISIDKGAPQTAESSTTDGAEAQVVKQKTAPIPQSPGSASLDRQMEGFLQMQKNKGRIRRQARTAWVAYDLTSDAYLVSVNAQRPFQAASMIKPFVALAFFHQVDAGALRYTAEHRRKMEAMIQHSSNAATNWFMRQVGGPRSCEAILKRSYKSIFRQVRIREYIPGDGRTYINSAPPAEYIGFLRALWKEQLPSAKELLRVMSLPGPDRIFYGTGVPDGTLVYNKTGTTARLCGDMGILAPLNKNGKRVPYAIVGIVEGPTKAEDYKQWMVASGGAIRDFSSLVYEAMKQKHDLR